MSMLGRLATYDPDDEIERLVGVVKKLQKTRRELRVALELVHGFPIPARAREILRAALEQTKIGESSDGKASADNHKSAAAHRWRNRCCL